MKSSTLLIGIAIGALLVGPGSFYAGVAITLGKYVQWNVNTLGDLRDGK